MWNISYTDLYLDIYIYYIIVYDTHQARERKMSDLVEFRILQPKKKPF